VNWQLATAALLGLGAALAVVRALREGRAARRDGRAAVRGVGDWAVWLQVPAAVLLYFVLYPPAARQRADALTFVTAGATRAELSTAPPDQPVVSLAGAPAPPGSTLAADLATALRAHPEVSRLTVIGGGLSARDRPVAATLSAIEFAAGPATGLLSLEFPASVPLGR